MSLVDGISSSLRKLSVADPDLPCIPISNTFPHPLLVTSAHRSPLLSSRAFVDTVVPIRIDSILSRESSCSFPMGFDSGSSWLRIRRILQHVSLLPSIAYSYVRFGRCILVVTRIDRQKLTMNISPDCTALQRSRSYLKPLSSLSSRTDLDHDILSAGT